ncbi:phospholipase-like protein [Tanacetum coccineum]|uniref:Phospholipase-like protein n=1 Tax=Tanacetum coccineum TaxID=301880 RepID=A0ABQ5F919_9ASTR
MLRKQHKVDSSHYDMPLIYYTEGHSLHFGRPEFALITGLPFGDVNFGLYTSRELKFRNRVFPHKLGSSVTNLDLIGVIEDEETFQKLCDEDSIRLCLILCLEVIFMGRLLTCPVDDTLFPNVIEKHSDEHYFGMKKDPKFGSFSHLKDAIVGGVKIQMLYQEQLVGRKSISLTDLIVVTFLRRPSKAEYESSWWIRSQLFFRQHVPKALVAQHHSMYETYLAKLEKSRKRVHSSFRTSSRVLTTLISTPKKWIRDQVISQLNLRVFKLETIIQAKDQVLARERKNEYGDLECKVIIRSKLNYFWLIKQKLDANRRILFRSSCFGCWLDLLFFDHEPQLIDYMLRKQHKVDSSHYDMPLIYYTEGHSLHFGRPEFALITGLPFGDVNFGLYTSGELKFRNRVFPHKLGSSVTNLDLIGVIEDEETFQKLCDEDSIRLCLILCLEVIFMGRLLTCPVDDTLFRLVESLEDWNCFPWGEHIWTHLYDQIQNVIEKHSDEHYFGMKKDPKYVPMYTLSGFVFAFQVWIFESFERCNCWWSKDPNVIPRAVGWSKKSIFNRSDCGYLFAKQSTTTSEIRPSKAEYESSWWIRSQLFFRQHIPKALALQHHSMYETCLAKLEKSRKRVHSSFRTSSGVLTTVLARERKNEYGLLQFKDEFSILGCEFMNSLNILFEELSQPLYTYENLSNDYLVEEELRLCLEAEEHIAVEKKRRQEFMNSSHVKTILGKLTHTKGNHVDSMPGKSKATDLSRSFHSLDTVWLTPDIQRFISREGNIKCKFPWSDDYTVGQNFWLTLVCLDPTRKGWLSEEHIDLWVDYMWHGRPDNANWAMVSCYFVQILLQNSTPLFYANGDKYATPWSDVDQVFFPINETAQHWCLAHFDIVSGLVTFYDSGDTYDYESRDFYVRVRECLKGTGSSRN